MGHGDGRDLEIVRADERTRNSELRTDSAVDHRSRIIERKTGKLAGKGIYQVEIGHRTRTLIGPVVKFAKDNGTESNVIRARRAAS
jgi:hypothetical protein